MCKKELLAPVLATFRMGRASSDQGTNVPRCGQDLRVSIAGPGLVKQPLSKKMLCHGSKAENDNRDQ